MQTHVTRRDERRIAIIGNDLELREVIAEILGLAGSDVVSIARDWDLLDDVAESRPGLIVLDLGLTEGGTTPGWDYLRRLRGHDRLGRVPVLICSGDIRALRARMATLQADPMVMALEKPFGVDELEQAVVALIDASPVPSWDERRELILVADADARIIDASDAALELLGLTADELGSRSVAEIVAHDAAWTNEQWQRYVSERRWAGAVTLRAADGRQVPAFARAEVIAVAGRDWHISRLEVAPIEPPPPPA